MTFWDGARWIDESKPQNHPSRKARRGRAARLGDLLATGAMIIVLGALLVPFTPARASGPVLTVSPASGAPGSSAQVVGTTFPSKVRLQVTWDGAASGMPDVQVNGSGAFKTTIVIPNAANGSHMISVAQVVKGSRSVAAASAPSLDGAFAVFTLSAPESGPTPTDPTPTDPTPTGPPPTVNPGPTVDPTGTADPGPTPGPTATPDPTAIPAPTPSAIPSTTPTPSPTANPTATSPPASANLVALGAYIPGAPSDPTRIDAYASLTGVMPNIVMWYQEWSGQWNAFYPKGADAIRARGAMPLISWEPWAGTNDPAWSLDAISNGSHDAYIHQWTRDVAAWGHAIYVRPMYEMNGPWSSWGYGVNGNTAADYVAAWRHIVDIAQAEGATNIRWVWCPNVDDGDPRYASYASLYPGDPYVDWVGLDGYNWGTTQSWSSWTSLYAVFKGSVDKVRAITAKPLMIAETGSTELGGDKAEWMTTGFASLLADLPQVRALIWFNVSQQADWRVDSSVQSLAAFRAVAASTAFGGMLP